IGVDNVDVPAATPRGIVVMNTPFGHSITTRERAMPLVSPLTPHNSAPRAGRGLGCLSASPRQIPAADASTQAGKWEKNRFMGVEMTAKTLGVIGCGNIGSILAGLPAGAQMKVEGDRHVLSCG